jgi:hypothetical protein
VVLSLSSAAWQNKPFALSAEQLSQLNLPVPTDSNLANPLKLNVTDVLLTPYKAHTSQGCGLLSL